jgi:hypothetical protein
VPTAKDRLDKAKRDLDRVERHWKNAGKIVGSAYSAAWTAHMDNQPEKLRPLDNNLGVFDAVVGVVVGRTTGLVFTPFGAAVVNYLIKQDIDDFVKGMMSPTIVSNSKSSPSPSDVKVDFPTPTEYQNNYELVISNFFGRFEEACDSLLDVIAGLKKSNVEVNDDVVDDLIDGINNTGLVPGPSGYGAWDNSQQLRREIEICMWQKWVMQLADENTFISASQLDLTKPIQRMAELKLVDGRIVATGGQRVAMSAELQLLKWANNYQPKRVMFMGQVPVKWSQIQNKFYKAR